MPERRLRYDSPMAITGTAAAALRAIVIAPALLLAGCAALAGPDATPVPPRRCN